MIESFKLITEKFMKKVLSSVVVASAFMASIAFAGNEVKVGSLKIENPQARATVPESAPNATPLDILVCESPPIMIAHSSIVISLSTL